MSLQFDPEFFEVFEPLIPLFAKRPKPTVQDIPANRQAREAAITTFFEKLPASPDVEQATYHVEAADGYQISVIGITKKNTCSKPGPAIVHYHGGGMTIGNAQQCAKPLARLVTETSIPIFSVNYRLAPESTGTTPVEDCYAALVWLSQNALEHNVDPKRIALYGESAGGGLAAGVALMARDRNFQPALAKQILIYPMLDDRNMTANDAVEPFAIFKTTDNVTSWTALLGDKAGKPDVDVSPYSAPARTKSLAGLPPAYIDVGELDIFRSENITYATRLMTENISTEFHLYPGLPHAFDMVAPNISATKRAAENRRKAMLSF